MVARETARSAIYRGAIGAVGKRRSNLTTLGNYDQTPLMLYWEVTRARDLACRHCRAEGRSADER